MSTIEVVILKLITFNATENYGCLCYLNIFGVKNLSYKGELCGMISGFLSS